MTKLKVYLLAQCALAVGIYAVDCPSQEAFENCPGKSGSDCKSDAWKDKCKWCPTKKTCIPGTGNGLCGDPLRFADCEYFPTSDPPTMEYAVTASPTVGGMGDPVEAYAPCEVDNQGDCDPSLGCEWNNSDDTCTLKPDFCGFTSEFFCEELNDCYWMEGLCFDNTVIGTMNIVNTVVEGKLSLNGISLDDIGYTSYVNMERALMNVFGADKVFMELSDTDCGLAPLCGEQGEMLPVPPGYKEKFVAQPDMLSPCCAIRDTKPEDDCQVMPKPGESTCRAQGIFAPFCNVNNEEEKCDMLVEEVTELIIQVQKVVPETDNCCHTCTCYGDPHCISFNGTTDTWNVCDARDPITCKHKEEVCESLLDPSGIRNCQWDSSNSHNWLLDGSRCQPHPDTPQPWMAMYVADAFAMSLRMGERGVITAVNVVLSDAREFVLDAEHCFEHLDDSWTGGAIPDTWYFVWEDATDDGVWYIDDAVTGIYAKLRCYRNEVDGVFGTARINVDELVEPNLFYNENRENLNGVCHTGNIEDKVGDNENTDIIMDVTQCFNLNDDMEIARLVCNNPAMRADGVPGCIDKFCSDRWYPNFSSKNQCVEITTKSWKNGYCRAYHHEKSARRACRDDIEDFGWEQAVDKYNKLDEELIAQCISDIEKLPEDLEECGQGIRIQYKDEEGNWITFRAIPHTFTICPDGLLVKAKDYPELFVRPVRLRQCSLDRTCNVDSACVPEFGFQSRLTFERTNTIVQSPSEMPTESPTTSWPTGSPTVWPTGSPTVWPTDKPTGSPTVWPTDKPTASPSVWPTGSPTVWPTDKPTASPSVWPTGSPTSKPTDRPTTYPTSKPTRYPTYSPTPKPTTKKPTPEPTESPTTRLTNDWPARDPTVLNHRVLQRAENRKLQVENGGPGVVAVRFISVFTTEQEAQNFLNGYNNGKSYSNQLTSLFNDPNGDYKLLENGNVQIGDEAAGFSESVASLKFEDLFNGQAHTTDAFSSGMCNTLAQALDLACGLTLHVESIFPDPDDDRIIVIIKFGTLTPTKNIEELQNVDILDEIQDLLRSASDPMLNSLTLSRHGDVAEASMAGATVAIIAVGLVFSTGMFVFGYRRFIKKKDQTLGMPTSNAMFGK